jgi:hypothetical protein
MQKKIVKASPASFGHLMLEFEDQPQVRPIPIANHNRGRSLEPMGLRGSGISWSPLSDLGPEGFRSSGA